MYVRLRKRLLVNFPFQGAPLRSAVRCAPALSNIRVPHTPTKIGSGDADLQRGVVKGFLLHRDQPVVTVLRVAVGLGEVLEVVRGLVLGGDAELHVGAGYAIRGGRGDCSGADSVTGLGLDLGTHLDATVGHELGQVALGSHGVFETGEGVHIVGLKVPPAGSGCGGHGAEVGITGTLRPKGVGVVGGVLGDGLRSENEDANVEGLGIGVLAEASNREMDVDTLDRNLSPDSRHRAGVVAGIREEDRAAEVRLVDTVGAVT